MIDFTVITQFYISYIKIYLIKVTHKKNIKLNFKIIEKKKNVIKPGEKITFAFTFKSNVTGIFYENWALKCEP